MCLLYIDRCANDSLCLHLCNLRISNCKTAASVSHHRVELMQRGNDVLDHLNALALCSRKLLNILLVGRNKLMQRRIQETNRNRIALKSLKQALEISLLIRKDLIKRCLSLLYGI